MRSTVGQLRDFRSGFVWKDIVEELDIWLQMIHDNLENPDMVMDHRMLDRLGGCAEAVRNFSNIVDVLVGIAEDGKDGRETLLNTLIKGGKGNE